MLVRASLQDVPQQHTPQPLADISLGAGRLASQMVQSITNPKEDKDLAKKRREWQKKQDEEKAQEEAAKQQQDEEQQQQQLADVVVAADAAAQEADALIGEAAAVAAAVPEAVAAAGERSIVSEYTEEVFEEEPKTMQQRVTDARQFLTSTATGKGISIAAGLFLGATLLIAMFRTWQKYSSPRAQRMRVVSGGPCGVWVCVFGGSGGLCWWVVGACVVDASGRVLV